MLVILLKFTFLFIIFYNGVTFTFNNAKDISYPIYSGYSAVNNSLDMILIELLQVYNSVIEYFLLTLYETQIIPLSLLEWVVLANHFYIYSEFDIAQEIYYLTYISLYIKQINMVDYQYYLKDLINMPLTLLKTFKI